MQEPVYVLYLITCHGHIMPRLVELLFFFIFSGGVCLAEFFLLFQLNEFDDRW